MEENQNPQMNIIEKLLAIQGELKVPKNQTNNFGNYKFRSCEDILEAVKPICQKLKTVLILNDEVVQIGERYYVRANAILIDTETNDTYMNTAYAREEEEKKGMDRSQITGATSSYARKYALNGLFALDDNKDADTNEYCKIIDSKNIPTKTTTEQPKLISEAQRKRLFAIGNGNTDIIKRHIEKYGYKKTEEIKVVDYQTICNEIEEEMNF